MCNPFCEHTHTNVASSQKQWWQKLVSEWMSGRTKQAIFVSFSIELFQTSQVKTPPMQKLPLDFPFCIPSTRLSYDREVGWPVPVYVNAGSPPHASAIIYLPEMDTLTGGRRTIESIERFKGAFSPIGKVVLST